MADAVLAALHLGERMGIEQRVTVTRQDLDGIVLDILIQKMSSEMTDTAF